MNKRIKKKLNKRGNQKTYLGYRKYKLNKLIQKFIDDNDIDESKGGVLIYLVISRKANYKTIHKLQVFTGVYPKGINADINQNREVEISFNCNSIS